MIQNMVTPLLAKRPHLLFIAVLATMLELGVGPTVGQAATFTVNNTADAVDAAPGDGVCAATAGTCTLRAAIEEANAPASADTINLPAGIYTLTLGSELPINEDLTLTGAGEDTTIIQAATAPDVANFRVFNITGGNVAISGVTIRSFATASAEQAEQMAIKQQLIQRVKEAVQKCDEAPITPQEVRGTTFTLNVKICVTYTGDGPRPLDPRNPTEVDVARLEAGEVYFVAIIRDVGAGTEKLTIQSDVTRKIISSFLSGNSTFPSDGGAEAEHIGKLWPQLGNEEV